MFCVTDKNELVAVKDAATCNLAVRQVVGERPVFARSSAVHCVGGPTTASRPSETIAIPAATDRPSTLSGHHRNSRFGFWPRIELLSE
jgi:hypothetical protein